MSRKVIFVGECVLDIIFESMRPVTAAATGMMPMAARLLAGQGVKAGFAGEASADRAGDFIVDELRRAGVDVEMIDRPADSSTTLRLIHTDCPEADAVYAHPSRERLSFGWPMTSPGDIIVTGSYFALAPRSRPAVTEFMEMCSSRGMIIVGLPGFESKLEPAITHVMPALLDNLELTDIVFTANDDLAHLWRCDNVAECFRRNVGFYTNLLIDINQATGIATQCTPSDTTIREFEPSQSLAARALAGFLAALANDPRTDITSIISNPPQWQPIL